MLPGKRPRKKAAYGLPADLSVFLKSTQDVQTIMAHGVNADGSLKPQTIRALLRFKGVEVTALAESNGYSEAYFRQIIDRTRKDVTVEDVIAGSLGLEANRIWGRLAVHVAWGELS